MEEQEVQQNTRMEKQEKLDFKIILLGVIALIFLGLFFGFFVKNMPNTTTTHQEKNATSTQSTHQEAQTKIDRSSNRVTYWPKNFSMKILDGWKAIDKKDISPPKDFSGIEFAYNKTGTECVFGYFRTASSSLQKYEQANFATRVFTTKDNYQLDASWYIHKTELPQNHTFNWDDETPAQNGIRINSFPIFYNSADKNYIYTFVLFSNDRGTVSTECDFEFSAMLATLSSEYKAGSINKNDTGVAYIASDRLEKESYLFFEPESDGIARKIMPLRLTQPSVYKGELYFIDLQGYVNNEGSGNLLTFDLITEQETPVITMDSTDGKIINNYYFSDNDKIYYLYGVNCKYYLPQCKLQLYEFDRNIKQAKLLAENIPYGNINGLDRVTDKLYMSHSDGDAGCFWIQLGIFDLKTNKFVEETDYSGCFQNAPPEEPASLDLFNERIKQFSDDSTSYDVIPIVNGKIQIPTGNEPSPGGRQSIRYINP